VALVKGNAGSSQTNLPTSSSSSSFSIAAPAAGAGATATDGQGSVVVIMDQPNLTPHATITSVKGFHHHHHQPSSGSVDLSGDPTRTRQSSVSSTATSPPTPQLGSMHVRQDSSGASLDASPVTHKRRVNRRTMPAALRNMVLYTVMVNFVLLAAVAVQIYIASGRLGNAHPLENNDPDNFHNGPAISDLGIFLLQVFPLCFLGCCISLLLTVGCWSPCVAGSRMWHVLVWLFASLSSESIWSRVSR
jgi:hypothetical protein